MVTRFTVDKVRPKGNDSIHINFDKQRVTGRLTTHYFIDNGHHICYIPSLGVTSYGESEQEALERMMHDIVDDLFTNLVELSPDKADIELQRMGWQKNKWFGKRFLAKSFIDKDGVLKNFNLPAGTEVKTQVLTAA